MTVYDQLLVHLSQSCYISLDSLLYEVYACWWALSVLFIPQAQFDVFVKPTLLWVSSRNFCTVLEFLNSTNLATLTHIKLT